MKRFISRIPKYGDISDDVRTLQLALRDKHIDIKNDGEYGPETFKAVQKIQIHIGTQDPGILNKETLEYLDLEVKENKSHVSNPAYEEAKQYAGKKESDSKFNKFMSGFWAKVGHPSFKTIAGSSFAWCALFIVAMNTESGLSTINSASAKSFARYGVAVDWKNNGIPKGAVIHINHNSKCSSDSSNHVTFADGDCSASDLNKKGASFPGFGGNQSNTVKRSMFPIEDICEVRWPKELPFPGKITKSIGCSGVSQGQESTQ